MTIVMRTFTVRAPAAAVLEYFQDFGNARQWEPAARARILGVTTELTYTLAAVERDRLVFIGRNEGATSTDTITVRPVEAGTEVTYHVDLEMHGLAKLATRVLRTEFDRLATETVARLTVALNRLATLA